MGLPLGMVIAIANRDLAFAIHPDVSDSGRDVFGSERDDPWLDRDDSLSGRDGPKSGRDDS